MPSPPPVSSRPQLLLAAPAEEQLEWTTVITYGDRPPPRGGHCAHVSAEAMYIYGGCTTPNPQCFNDLYSLNVGTHFLRTSPQ